MVENPVATISSHWRKPDFTFDPCDYRDPYTKKTCLWTSGAFVMPPKKRVKPTLGSKMHGTEPRQHPQRDTAPWARVHARSERKDESNQIVHTSELAALLQLGLISFDGEQNSGFKTSWR